MFDVAVVSGRAKLRFHSPLVIRDGDNRPADGVLVYVRAINALILVRGIRSA